MDLKGALIQVLFRPKVVHGLPGRLRVHIPFVSRIDPTRRDLSGLVSRLLTVPEGIESAEVAPATGNVLVLYDVGKLSQDEVFGFIKGLAELFLKNRDRLADLPPERIADLAPALESIVRKALGRRLALDTNVEIPDDVLA